MTATLHGETSRWTCPALFSYGFRPFFLLGALWAAAAMVLWVLMLSGALALPTAFDSVSWHAHAFLFGYVGAVLAGFLLTAIPNWTGRPPIAGLPLASLVALWAAGRIAVLVSAHLPHGIVVGVDLAFPLALGALVLREIVAGRNWRNLVVLVLLAIFALANGLFHAEAARGGYPAEGPGLRLGLACVLTMIALIGGRIVPSFTRNWLIKRHSARLPAPSMQRFDVLVMVLSVAVMLLWVLRPLEASTGSALVIFAALNVARLLRWQGHLTMAEPLLFVLHLGYAMLPVGAAALALAQFAPGIIDAATAQHVWMAGALGLMTLAVMSRATLGHTGQALHADGFTVALFTLVVLSVLARVLAGILPPHLGYDISAVLWVTAFSGFVIAYGPLLLRR